MNAWHYWKCEITKEQQIHCPFFLVHFLHINNTTTLNNDIVAVIFHYDFTTNKINHRKPPKPIMTHGSTSFKLCKSCASLYGVVGTNEVFWDKILDFMKMA